MPVAEARVGRTPEESSALEQIRELREQVETLVRERARSMMSGAADRASEAVHRAEDAARRMGSLAQDQTEVLSKTVQDRPLTSVLIAAAAGYLVGRLMR
jgi:ElaB/YqjD/DUF883 family membrane-anchored ribosome-binding protein